MRERRRNKVDLRVAKVRLASLLRSRFQFVSDFPNLARLQTLNVLKFACLQTSDVSSTHQSPVSHPDWQGFSLMSSSPAKMPLVITSPVITSITSPATIAIKLLLQQLPLNFSCNNCPNFSCNNCHLCYNFSCNNCLNSSCNNCHKTSHATIAIKLLLQFQRKPPIAP